MSVITDLGQPVGREQALALETLSASGTLPNDHYWNSVRHRAEVNPARFSAYHPIEGALVNVRDACGPLFPDTPFWRSVGARHSANSARFDNYHPWLGKLLELTRCPDTPSHVPVPNPVFGLAPGEGQSPPPPVFAHPDRPGTGVVVVTPTAPPCQATVPEPYTLSMAMLAVVALVMARFVRAAFRKGS